MNEQKKGNAKISTVKKNSYYSTGIKARIMNDIYSFEPAEHFSLSNSRQFQLAKMSKLHSEIFKQNLKVSTDYYKIFTSIDKIDI